MNKIIKEITDVFISLFFGFGAIIITALIANWITGFEDMGFLKDEVINRYVFVVGVMFSIITYGVKRMFRSMENEKKEGEKRK